MMKFVLRIQKRERTVGDLMTAELRNKEFFINSDLNENIIKREKAMRNDEVNLLKMTIKIYEKCNCDNESARSFN